MIRTLFIAFLFLSTQLSAQSYDDNRFRLSGSLTFNGPLGQQHFRTSDRFITGKSRAGVGFYFTAAKPLYKGFMLGINVNHSSFTLLEGELKKQLAERYAQPDYFINATVTNLSIRITQIGIELAKNVDFKGGCFSPFVRLSIATIDADPILGARLKLRNDNYFIQYSIAPDFNNEETFDAFLPSFGFNLEGRISDYCWVHGGISYTGGAYKLRFKETSVDLYEQRKTSELNLQQPVSMINVALGVQCRFGRR